MEKRESAGHDNPEARIEGMARKIEELEAKVRNLEAEKERLEKLSTHDPLTGILNRRGGHEEIELIAAGIELPEGEEEKRGEGKLRPRRKFSVFLADIDDFKAINDTYGHDIGDVVIKSVAEFLKKETRRSDVVARWGGEEFLVAFQSANAQDVINKFFDKSAKKPRISLTVKTEKGDIEVTLSGGSTDYIPGENLDKAVDRADQALYKSKESGKNRITKYEESGK